MLSSPVLIVLGLIALPGSGARAADSVAAFGVMAGILLAVAYAFRALEPTIDDRALMLRVPEHVWMRLIVRLGRQRLEELLAADEAAVRRAAWAAFRERLQMEEWRA